MKRLATALKCRRKEGLQWEGFGEKEGFKP